MCAAQPVRSSYVMHFSNVLGTSSRYSWRSSFELCGEARNRTRARCIRGGRRAVRDGGGVRVVRETAAIRNNRPGKRKKSDEAPRLSRALGNARDDRARGSRVGGGRSRRGCGGGRAPVLRGDVAGARDFYGRRQAFREGGWIHRPARVAVQPLRDAREGIHGELDAPDGRVEGVARVVPGAGGDGGVLLRARLGIARAARELAQLVHGTHRRVRFVRDVLLLHSARLAHRLKAKGCPRLQI